jgi:hypothetical protein
LDNYLITQARKAVKKPSIYNCWLHVNICNYENDERENDDDEIVRLKDFNDVLNKIKLKSSHPIELYDIDN